MGLGKSVFVAVGVGLAARSVMAAEVTGESRAPLASPGVAWSRSPPGGLASWQVPEFVAITFDDNFTSGLGDAKGGMTWATTFMRPLANPAGLAEAGTFDGSPVRTSFYFTSFYIEGDTMIPQDMQNQLSWRTAYGDGHEPADHTRLHATGGALFALAQWIDEIQVCKQTLIDPVKGIGAVPTDIVGFRAPYLAYNANMFAALVAQGFLYDTSIASCYDDVEDGTNCAWPYTLDEGSPDAVVFARKFGGPTIDAYPSFWEAPLSALVVPPDEVATQYQFAPGLRTRIAALGLAFFFYEPATAKIQPVDLTMFQNAQMTSAEVTATLMYNLDLHLAGNRAPIVIVAHSHVYASNFAAASRAPDYLDRQQAIEKFVAYALTKPVVRMRPVRDILGWMQAPVALKDAVRPEGGLDDARRDDDAPSGASGSGGRASDGGGAPTNARTDAGSNAIARTAPNGSCSCTMGDKTEKTSCAFFVAVFAFSYLASRASGSARRSYPLWSTLRRPQCRRPTRRGGRHCAESPAVSP